MNNISIIGRLTKDVELTTTSNGLKKARFAVAVRGDGKTDNGEQRVDFFVCVAWREMAENIAKFFKKGSNIGIIGSMNNRNYEDSNGNKQSIWELNVKGFSFVGDFKKESKQEQVPPPKEAPPINDDDYPF